MGGIEEKIKQRPRQPSTSEKLFPVALDLIFVHEGGYVNHPQDPGGETKYGISKRAYPKEDIKNLTKTRAGFLYRRDYWDRCRCDSLPFPLAVMLFDEAVNAGPGAAIPRFQRAIGVADDGIIGPITLREAQLDVALSLDTYRQLREQFYRRLSKFPVFGRGWLNRLSKTYAVAKQYLD